MNIRQLNIVIHENLKNRSRYIQYQLLEEISKNITFGIKIPDRQIKDPETYISMDRTVEIVLEFFRNMDSELYEKAKAIIDKKTDFDFKMYDVRKIVDFDTVTAEGLPVYSSNGLVISQNGKKCVYIPCKETLNDCFILVHELSHTFDFIDKYVPARELLGEATPYIFEAMLGQYLIENNLANREEIINHEKFNIISGYDDSVETYAKLMLMKIKVKNGEIKESDLENIRRAYELNPRTVKFIIDRMIRNPQKNVDYRARYMNATIIYPYFMECYYINPQESIANLKKYFEAIKSNDFNGALETLGIEPKADSIPLLIKSENRRIERLFKRRMFDSLEDKENFIKNENHFFEEPEN